MGDYIEWPVINTLLLLQFQPIFFLLAYVWALDKGLPIVSPEALSSILRVYLALIAAVVLVVAWGAGLASQSAFLHLKKKFWGGKGGN